MKFRVYRIMNRYEGTIIEIIFEADSIEQAERIASRRAKKAGLLPNQKHSQTYGTFGWVDTGDGKLERSFVFGDKWKSKSIKLFLEVLPEGQKSCEHCQASYSDDDHNADERNYNLDLCPKCDGDLVYCENCYELVHYNSRDENAHGPCCQPKTEVETICEAIGTHLRNTMRGAQ